MKTKYITSLFILFIFFVAPAQTNLDGYKYIIVPDRFDFLNESDQYQLNSLTKFLFNKNNFTVYLDNENLPEDLFKDRCLALYTKVLRKKSMFKTRLTIELQDCNKNIVFVTKEGASKEKNYKKAYHESMREAFQSFKSVKYSYNPELVKREQSDIEKPNDNIKNENSVVSSANLEKNNKEKTVAIPHTDPQTIPNKTNSSIKSQDIIIIKEAESKIDKPKIKDSKPTDLLYAQAIDNGFQLVDSTPKVVYTIFYSGKKDIFIVKGKNAVVYQLNETWVIAEQIGDNLEVTSLKIKF